MADELGVVSAHVMLIAPEYFAGLSDDFIRFQINASFDTQRARILASTWDLFLLTLPATLLGSGDQDSASLAMICTIDQAFARIGKRFSLETVFCQNGGSITPGFSYDYTTLKDAKGITLVEEIESNAEQFMRERLKVRRLRGRFPKDVSVVVRNMESKLDNLCKSLGNHAPTDRNISE